MNNKLLNKIKKFIKKNINILCNNNIKIKLNKKNDIFLKFTKNCNFCNKKKNIFINIILNKLKINFPELNNIYLI